MSEEWRDAPDYVGRYEVSNLGRVRSLTRVANCGGGWVRSVNGRVLRAAPTSKGYLGVTLYDGAGNRRTHHVHLLVAKAFVPNHECKPQVNHEDGVKANNAASNLTWATNKENQEHGAALGIMPRALANGNGKLSDESVATIKSLLRRGASPKDLAEQFNVSQSLVRYIRAGKRRA